MNNYTNEKERRLYFDDLWVRLKRSWVLVLAITLVFGILVISIVLAFFGIF